MARILFSRRHAEPSFSRLKDLAGIFPRLGSEQGCGALLRWTDEGVRPYVDRDMGAFCEGDS